jgi:hypothetical protein
LAVPGDRLGQTSGSFEDIGPTDCGEPAQIDELADELTSPRAEIEDAPRQPFVPDQLQDEVLDLRTARAARRLGGLSPPSVQRPIHDNTSCESYRKLCDTIIPTSPRSQPVSRPKSHLLSGMGNHKSRLLPA